MSKSARKPLAAVFAPLDEHTDPESGQSLVYDPLKEHFDILPVAIAENRTLLDAIPLDELSNKQKGSVELIVTDGENGVQGHHMDVFPNVVGISSFGVGIDSINIDDATKRGLLVCNTPGVLNSDTANLGVSHIMSLIHNAPRDNDWIRQGRWAEARPPLHGSFDGKVIGVYGMGCIGLDLAAKIQHFVNTPVHYHNRHEVPEDKLSAVFNQQAVYHSSLASLVEASDILVCTAPLNEETRNSIGDDVLRKLGSGGYLVNIGRGEIHDEQAVVNALNNGVIRAAALDVHHDERTKKENLYSLIDSYKLIATPHVGSATVETRQKMGRLMVANALALVDTKGQAFVRSVNALSLGIDNIPELDQVNVLSGHLVEDVRDVLALN